MTNSARLSGRPSSSAAYNVGDVVDTPDSAIKSWRYLGAGEWEPNDAVRYTTSPGGGNRVLVGSQELIQVAVVRQGIGSDLPSRPDAEIVHWYASDRVAPDADHPHDQVFPAGPLLLFERDQQGASHDAGNPSAVSNASGVGVLGGAISAMLDQSSRTNDAAGIGAARPTYYGRTNLLPTSENLDGWDKLYAGSGLAPVVTLNAGVAPDGSNTAIRVDLNCVDTSSTSHRSYVRAAHTSGANTEYKARIWLKAATPADVGKEVRLLNENTVEHSNLKHTLTADWTLVERNPVRTGTGTTTNWVIDCRGTVTQQQASVLLWRPELRYLGADAGVDPYQPITAAANYVTQGFPVGALFDGVDDAMTVAAGGGGTTGLFWCGAIRLGKLGAAQTLFADTGANTGYRVRINASNRLELSAGNGSAYTSIATARALKVGERAVCTAWHDGVNLYVQLDDGDIASTAFVTTTAGTAGYTIGKDNGAASSYFGGVLYAYCYLRNTSPSAPWRDLVQLYAAGKAKLPMGA